MKQRKFIPKAARVNAGLTLKEVAKQLGVTEVTLWNWERGATSPSIANAQRMADLYRIPLDEIQFYRG